MGVVVGSASAEGRRVRVCEECREPWVDLVNGQCHRCGNRTYDGYDDECGDTKLIDLTGAHPMHDGPCP